MSTYRTKSRQNTLKIIRMKKKSKENTENLLKEKKMKICQGSIKTKQNKITELKLNIIIKIIM